MEFTSPLFGDLFTQPKIENPRSVLDEVRAKIEQESNGSLSAEITQQPPLLGGNALSYSFSIKSNSTGYSYTLFYISHDVLMYPCFLNTEQLIFEQLPQELTPQYTNVNGASIFATIILDEVMLRNTIQRLCATERAKTIVRAIYSQS